MAEHMTPADRGHRMLRESGYAQGGAIHEDEAEDKKLIKQELGKARIKTRSKGGPIKGDRAKEHPGRRSRRAEGGHVPHKDHGKPGIGKVNIVIAKDDKPDMPTPVAGMMAPHPMAPAPGPMPGGPPPGAMPGGLPPRPMGGPPMPPPGAGPGGPPMMRPQGARDGGKVRDRMGRFTGGSV